MDEISISTHTDQAVSLLGENISLEEKAVLGGCEWSANEAVVHYDEEVRLSLFFLFFGFLVFWFFGLYCLLSCRHLKMKM